MGREDLDRDARLLREERRAAVGVRRDRVGRGDRELLDPRLDERLRGADVRVARAGVDLGERRGRVALRLDAGADHHEPLALVVLPVRAALGEARVADDPDHLVGLDQLACERRLLGRVELLVVEDVLDRPAVDAAVVVHAVEVRLRGLADGGEVDARDKHVDATELDRRAGRLLARSQTTDRLLRRRLARPDRRLCARRPTGEHQGQQACTHGRSADHRLRRSHGSLQLGRSRGGLARIPAAAAASRHVQGLARCTPLTSTCLRVCRLRAGRDGRSSGERATEPERHPPKAVLGPAGAHRRGDHSTPPDPSRTSRILD